MKSVIFFLVFARISALTTLPLNEDEMSHQNSSSDDILSRSKRLVFPGGGFARFIAGFLVPCDIPLYQNINALRNMQFFYAVPPNLMLNKKVWPGLGSRSFDGNNEENENKINHTPDDSRKIAYEVVEDILNREGKNGHECMLRAICEVAETPVNHNGIIGELMQIFFTPGEFERLDSEYKIARKAGLNNVNCEKLYADCPMGHGILDSFSLIKEFKLESFLRF